MFRKTGLHDTHNNSPLSQVTSVNPRLTMLKYVACAGNGCSAGASAVQDNFHQPSQDPEQAALQGQQCLR